MSDINHALQHFTLRYKEVFQQKLGELPRYYCGDVVQTSPCIEGKVQQGIAYWQAVERQQPLDLQQLSNALETQIPAELAAFYTYQFAAPMGFDSAFGCGELLQCWDEEDFLALQENLIGHVLMKRKLKQPDSFFLAVMDEGEAIVVMNSADPAVYLEVVGQATQTVVAPSLADFLQTIRPIVTPVKQLEQHAAEPPMSFWQSLIHAFKS